MIPFDAALDVLPHGVRPTLRRDLLPGLAFWATPGHNKPVWVSLLTMAFPADTSTPGLYSSNPKAQGRSGYGATVDGSNIGLRFIRNGSGSDAYIEIPTGSDYTWLWETDNIGYVGSNPGFYRIGPAGNTFALLPSSGLWIRQNGTDITSSIAAPAAGSTARAVIVAKSGAYVRAWINGVKVIDSTTAATTANQTSIDGCNYFWRHSESEYLTGQAMTVGLWHRALGDSTAQALSTHVVRNAYEPRRIWVPSAGGGSAVPTITAVSAENITATSADYRVTLDFA